MDHFISCYVPRSEQAKTFLIRQGIEGQKITDPIPHGYDEDIFFNDPKVEKERYIFSPSRLVFSKGVDVLLKAFALACQEVSDLKLIVQGEGPSLEEFCVLAWDLKIDEKVRFDTTRLNHDEMRARYQKSLATVVSSREDFVIFSAMESIACGTPVILSTGIDSHTDYRDGRGGLSFRNEDHEQLAGILVNVAKDNSFRKRLEREALEKSHKYKNSYISKQFLKVIQTTMTNE